MTSHQSSFDAEKAYDSTSKLLLDWSWQSIGVPKEVASWLAHIDVDGTTVIKSPFAEALWVLLPYRCVQTTGKYPAHAMEVPA